MNEEREDNEAKTSWLRRVIVMLLCVIPPVAAVAYGSVDPIAIGGLYVLAVVIILLWTIDAMRRGELEYSTNLIQLPVIGLIVLAAIQLLPLRTDEAAAAILSTSSAALSLDPYSTRFFLIQLVIYFIFFAAALVFVPGGKRPVRVGVALLVFGALLAFFGILQRLVAPAEAIYGLRATPQAIPFGPYVNQHHFASLMHMTSGIALGLLFGTGIGRERKLLVALAAGVMGIATVFTGSRGGMIGYLFVVGVAAAASFARGRKGHEDQFATDRRKRNLLVAMAAGALVVLVLGSVLMLGGQESLFRGIGIYNADTDLTSGRAHFWAIALKIFLDNPIIGVGFDAFTVAYTKFDTWNGLYRVERAHNDYLQILADGGLVGFALVATFMVLFVKQGIATIGNQKDRVLRSITSGAFAGCLGIMVHSFFDFPLRTPANAFFFLLCVVLVVGHGRETRRSNGR